MINHIYASIILVILGVLVSMEFTALKEIRELKQEVQIIGGDIIHD